LIEESIAKLALLLPFSYAFSAGMVTTVSPCGIAMLPAYVSLYLGTEGADFWSQSSLRRSARAIAMSAVVTLGFTVFFGIMGAILSFGGQFLVSYIPWIAVLIGATLIVLGIYLLAGGYIGFNLPARLAGNIISLGGSGFKGFLIFGIAYGIAALSCTLPVFLVVVGSAIATQGFTSGLLQFVSFALGMGLVITVVTIATALLKETINRWMRRLVPVVARFSGLLLILAGSYILYFWFKTGDILNLAP